MSWVKLDDGFPDHPKAAGLSDAAFRSYVTSLCYAARFLTDGFIPGAVARKMAAPKVLVQLSGPLWEEVEGGYQIHDYLAYNPTKEQVLAERQEKHAIKVKAGRAGAKARWHPNGRANSKHIAG